MCRTNRCHITEVPLYLDISLHEYIKISLQVSKWKWLYFSVLNVGTKNSNNMTVFTVGSWSCGTSAARPGREYCHVLLSYISVEIICVYCIDTLPFYQDGILRDGFLSRTYCNILVIFQESINSLKMKHVYYKDSMRTAL
jgi:hypothetical protein